MNAMMTNEQLKQYEAVVGEFEKYRSLTEEEKQLVAKQIMSGTYMDLRCDWAFKHVMQDKAILLMLLNDVLPEKVDEIETDPNEIDRFFEGDKDATMDILCHCRSTGRRFIVEIQQQRKTSFRDRMFYYGASMIHSQVRRGQPYNQLKPVYVLCFMDFQYPHLSDQLVYRYSMLEETTHESYGEQLNIYFFEMPRLRKESMSGMDPLEGWLYLLRNLHTFAEVPEGMDRRYARVFRAAQLTTLTDKEQLQYLRAMISEFEQKDLYGGGFEAGFEQGVERGREEGRAEGREEVYLLRSQEIARALLQMNLPLADIAKATGLSEEELRSL